MTEKKSNLLNCCELTDKTIEIFNEKYIYKHNTYARHDIFVYWSYLGLNKKRCSDCQKKWDKEWEKLQKDKKEEFERKWKEEEIQKEKRYQEEAERKGVINCLYSHFKNTPKKLKIVCDWDEVIQPLEPKVYYELSEREGVYYDAPWWKPNGTPFAEFFRDFWPNAPIYFSDYGSHSIYTEKSMINSCINKSDGFALGMRNIKEKIDKIKNESDFYENSPFLTLAKELLKLVKENKAEVIFLSAYDKRAFPNGDPRKKKIFSETFGKYFNCSLNLVGFASEGQGQSKSEWVKENVPDCDIVIDDNPNILSNVVKNNDKIIVIAPFYSTIKHHKRVLLIKTSLSDLTKNDF
ncbi:MAG: hypothetical protein I3274_08090 [Candidatus Moeniiplasma glomeromycotorum]|nr:hypothetical protein [Candidatus Moeniiplasma glomeromycotorum]